MDSDLPQNDLLNRDLARIFENSESLITFGIIMLPHCHNYLPSCFIPDGVCMSITNLYAVAVASMG